VRTRHPGYLTSLTAAFSLSAAAATANCQLQQLGALPVDMQGLRPLVWTKINGVTARFALDSGAFYSTIWRDTATQYQLSVTSAPGGNYYISGSGGRQTARVTTIDSFEFLGIRIRKIQFAVIDQTFAYDYVGLIGQNILRLSDVEYDLANGIVRFFKPVGCETQPLAYWAVNAPYTVVDLQPIDVVQDHLIATAIVNGKRMTAYFDTGAPRSYLSLQAATRAGITPDSAGVTYLGLTGGLGPGSNKVWSAPVDSFQLGGEKVQHTHLLISDLNPAHQVGEVGDETPDMLLGEDFFLSHRIYVAYSQRKLYFTYNGGPLFNLNLPEFAAGSPQSPSSPGASAATPEQPFADTPTDADGFRRQGMAYASMQELDLALADLTRACGLAPNDADAHYDRGLIYERQGQFKPALQDFSTAITLQPDDVDARLARVYLLQSHPDTDPAAAPEIKSDLDTVSRLSAPAAAGRLVLAQLYGTLGDYPAAIDQLDQWLDQRRLPGDQITGLNARCWLRATSNRDLRQALDDCDQALNLRTYSPEETGTLIRAFTDNPDVLDSRALVYLRLGKLDDAIHDYDSALHTNPNIPTSLYGRGLAELRLGEKAQGQADLDAAGKLDSGIAKRFADMGLAP
jgi:tetratricopeptide (TPR) repeat protein/predicted aspartyl protease